MSARCGWVAIALTLWAAPIQAQRTGAGLVAQIDSIVAAEMGPAHTVGVTVAVEQRGRLILAKGYGYEDLEQDVPATAETVFKIGSITKQFTAVGVMQLVEQGKLRLEDEITAYLPDYPTQNHHVTLHHLLTHTSGIKSYTSLGPAFWGRAARLDLAEDQLIGMFDHEPFDFAPGERYLYNNSAFFLLGRIIGKVSGEPYPAYLQRHILAPLGLTNTSYCDDRALVPHRAEGYEVVAGVLKRAAPISMTAPGAAGSICSTVLDLLGWQRSFNAATLISPASRDRIRTEATLTSGQGTHYGYGVGVGALGGRRLFSHSGGINGFVSWLGYFPDDDLTIAVLTNTDGGPAPRVGQSIARSVLGLAPDSTARRP
ncbi:MAG: serine hydrolase domain-containing protein [Gemmatimonadota bacterium]